MQFDEEYFKSKDFNELLESYEAAVCNGDRPYMDAEDLVDIADYYNYSGNYEKAVDTVNYALQLFPHSTLPNVFKAREALATDDVDTARKYADAIEDKDDPDYHYIVAEIMIASGDIEKADEYLHEYGKGVEPEEYQDFIKDCANLFLDYDVYDKAHEWILCSQGDDSDDFKELKGRALFGMEKYEEAQGIFNELIDRNPYSKTYWNELASAQYLNGEYDNAITSSEYAIAIDPNDAEALANKANGLFHLGNFQESLKYFRRYSEQIPNDPNGLLQQGMCLVNTNQKEEALPLLEEAARLGVNDPELLAHIYQELAFCYSATKQPDKALEMLSKAYALPCDRIDLLIIRGHILLENFRVEEAKEAFNLAINESGHSPVVMLRVIVSLYDNNYVETCYSLFKEFFQIVEQSGKDYNGGYAYMALCCYELHKDDEFLHYLELAIEKNPREAQAVLGSLFPKDIELKDYYNYMLHQLKL